MDPEVAQMMADLGVQRRDIVSAPEERGGGRRGGGDWRDEMRAMNEAQEHRKQACSGPEDNAKAQMLKMWNTETTFGSDAIADSLENRMDGQGHRARLREQLHHEQAQFNDNHRPGRNYHHEANDHPPPDRGRPSEQDRTPRNLNFAALPPPRAAPAPDPNRARAPDPRAAGVTKFRNGQRVSSSTTPATATSQPPRMPAAMRPNGMPAQAPRPTPHPARSLSPAKLPAQATRPAPAVSAPSRPIDAPQPASTRATPMAPSTSSFRPQTAAAIFPSSSRSPDLDPFALLAYEYVQNPSANYEKYYQSRPDEAHYVDDARKAIAVEAVEWVSSGRKEAYIKRHAARNWIVEVAEAALLHGEVDTPNPLTKPTVLAIIRAAAEKIQKEKAAKAPALSTPAFPPEASATAASAAKSSQPPATPAPSAPAPTRSANVAPPQSRPMPGSFPTLKDMVKERGEQAVKVAAPRRTEGSQTATSTVSPTHGTPSRRDSVMDINSPAAAPPGVPTDNGMLTATYLDARGQLVQQNQIRVEAPVMAHITITSTRHHYDPRQLAEAMQTLARQMAERSIGNFYRDEDGLWGEARALGLID